LTGSVIVIWQLQSENHDIGPIYQWQETKSQKAKTMVLHIESEIADAILSFFTKDMQGSAVSSPK
jgi:hypothetical protein